MDCFLTECLSHVFDEVRYIFQHQMGTVVILSALGCLEVKLPLENAVNKMLAKAVGCRIWMAELCEECRQKGQNQLWVGSVRCLSSVDRQEGQTASISTSFSDLKKKKKSARN